MKIAVLTLKTVLDSLLTWVRNDYVYYNTLSTPAPEKSWLYSTFYGNSHGNFDYYVQAVNMISRTDVDQNKLSTRLMFDTSRANLPTIHIHMPSETPGKFTALNGQIGFSGLDDDNNAQMDLARSFGSTYDLIITGGNSEEVILIYELLQALFIAGHDTIQNYFAVFDYAGNELMVNPEIIPYNTFYRAFRVSVQEERIVRSIVELSTVSGIYFNGKSVEFDPSEPQPEPIPYPPQMADWFITNLKSSEDGGFIPKEEFDWLKANAMSVASFLKEITDKIYKGKYLSAVNRDNSLSGNGTIDSPLGTTKELIPDLKKGDTPEFTDLAVPALNTTAETGGEISTTLWTWIQGVYSSIVAKSTKSHIIGLWSTIRNQSRLLRDITISQDVSSLSITTDSEGNALNIQEGDVLRIICNFPTYAPATTSGYFGLRLNGITNAIFASGTALTNYWRNILGDEQNTFYIDIQIIDGYAIMFWCLQRKLNGAYASVIVNGYTIERINSISSLYFLIVGSCLIRAGSKFRIKQIKGIS